MQKYYYPGTRCPWSLVQGHFWGLWRNIDFWKNIHLCQKMQCLWSENLHRSKEPNKKTYHCWGGAIILSYGQDGATVGLTSAFVHAFKYPTFSRWSGCQGAGAQCTGVRRRRHSQQCRTIKPTSQTPHSLLQGGLVNTNNTFYCKTRVCFIFEIFEIEQFWISVSEYQSCLRHFANYYAGKAFFSPNCQDVAMINGRRSLSKK